MAFNCLTKPHELRRQPAVRENETLSLNPVSFCKTLFLFYYVYGCFVYMYVSIPHKCLVPREARRWHETAVSCHMGTVSATQVLRKGSQFS